MTTTNSQDREGAKTYPIRDRVVLTSDGRPDPEGAVRRLKTLLENGPQESEWVLSEMFFWGGHGLSAVRRARQSLGVLIRRFGAGRLMRSRWALPGHADRLNAGEIGVKVEISHAQTILEAMQHLAKSHPGSILESCLASVETSRFQDTFVDEAPVGQPSAIERPAPDSRPEGRGIRWYKREEFFVSIAGLARKEAQELASLLEERDAMGFKVWSCAECQVRRLGVCDLEREPLVLHSCPSARPDSP